MEKSILSFLWKNQKSIKTSSIVEYWCNHHSVSTQIMEEMAKDFPVNMSLKFSLNHDIMPT